MTDCPCCCDHYHGLRKAVKCQFCDYESCQHCYHTYTTSGNSLMHCMECKKEWSDDFIFKNFTKKFVNGGYKQHREQLLMESQKILLPQTQQYMGAYQRLKKFFDSEEEKVAERRILIDQISELYTQIDKLRPRSAQLATEINDIQYYKFHPDDYIMQRLRTSKPNTSVKWTWACPHEGCKGFVNTVNKCGTCERQFCQDCNEEITDEHVCNEDIKASVQLLKRDSKPCPACQTVIHKIDGCDQMWCPDCQTAYSWRTGKIETHHVHNPHYYEFLRDNQGFVPRDPGDNPCGGDNNRIGRFQDYPILIQHPMFLKMHRLVTHGMWAWRAQWNVEVAAEKISEERRRYHRLKYMANDMPEGEWKVILQRNQKAYRKVVEIRGIIDTFIQLMTDVINNSQEFVGKTPQDIMDELQKVVQYFKNVFYNISKNYNCVVPYISSDNTPITLKH